MKLKRLPAGFVIPAQSVSASKPPSGADWVHEIKHDGYRLIVRWDGTAIRLYTRDAFDLTARLPAIAAAAERIRPRASRSTARRWCSALTACHDSTNCADGRLRKPRSSMPSTSSSTVARVCTTARSSTVRLSWRQLLRDTKAGILLNEHIAEDGVTVRSRRRRNRSDQ
jgi:hypothetical protein